MEGETRGLEVSRRGILNERGRHHRLPQTLRLQHLSVSLCGSVCDSVYVTVRGRKFIGSFVNDKKGFFSSSERYRTLSSHSPTSTGMDIDAGFSFKF